MLTRSMVLIVVASLGSCGGSPSSRPDSGDGGVDCRLLTTGSIVFDAQDDVQTGYSAAIDQLLGGGASDFLVLRFINYNERQGELALGTFPFCAAMVDDGTQQKGYCLPL